MSKLVSINHKMLGNIPLLEVVRTNEMENQLPTVVLYHGWTNCKESLLMHAHDLAQRNIRVVIPDAVMHGARGEERLAEENYENLWKTISTSLQELPQIYSYYTEQKLSNKELFSVGGQSMGGITTLMCFKEYPWLHSAVSLMGTPEPYKRSIGLLDLPWVEETGRRKEDFLADFSLLKNYDLSLEPEAIAGRPLLLWHGKKDILVPYETDLKFYEKVKKEEFGKNVSLALSENAGHEVGYEESLLMADFFEKYFQTNSNQ